jgi:LPXTG-site transpeptidase (sortase) family protein
MAQSALEREMLLVPVPGVAVDDLVGTPAPADPGGSGATPSIRLLAPLPTTSPAYLVRSALIVLVLLVVGLVLQLTWISGLEHRSSQVSLFNQFRTELALGTAPLGPVTTGRHALAPGSPMAYLTIPAIGVRQVVVEGTTGSQLTAGPGHLRDTVFPGGAGTSIILGRASAYGGPFGHIASLRPGDKITVVTQVGTSVFRVVDVRHAGSKDREVAAGRSRLTLGTASGPAFAPSGVLWVDADKVGAPLAAQSPLVTPAELPPSERPLGTDTSTVWALFLWLEAFGLILAGAVWTWRRRGHAQALIAFAAPVLVVWLFVADQVTRLLPNLL